MRSARALACIAALVAGALPCAALAQWQWIDQSGRRVFSDKAPPPDVPERNILKQPGGRAAAPAPSGPAAAGGPSDAAVPAGTAPALASGPRPSGRDASLEQRRKQLEGAEADKRKAEEQAVAEQKADNCARSRQAKSQLDSGVRIARQNDKGEREFLDDKQRASEAQRLQGLIERDCPAQ